MGNMPLKGGDEVADRQSVSLVSRNDDGVSLLTPDDYIEFRLQPALERCQVRTPPATAAQRSAALSSFRREPSAPPGLLQITLAFHPTSQHPDGISPGLRWRAQQAASRYNSRVLRVGNVFMTLLGGVGTILVAIDFRVFIVRCFQPSPTGGASACLSLLPPLDRLTRRRPPAALPCRRRRRSRHASPRASRPCWSRTASRRTC